MADTIDKKIVEMSFENEKFEKGVSTSLNTVDKLKKGLNFDNVGKSFANITSAAQKVSLSSIADGINHISSKFSAMSIVAITALASIVNSAVQAGIRITKALTVDPIAMGLSEYETLMGSIQTVLANTQSKGTTLDQVNDALNLLNQYSDKTIYNFQQMARNIGTFTAAGVDLDTSVSAIKGIANLAAISGSNADQASTAMYQLSQALASGTVKLMDWNSVVNAGMGGQVFQDALKETARLHGVAIDQMIKDEGSFRNTLEKGWLTSNILTETLSKFTGDLNEDQLRTMGYSEDQIRSIIKLGQTANDAATKVKTFSQLFTTLKEAAQSGWAKTWQLIIGDFEEAKSFLTDLNAFFGGILNTSADARNQILEGWRDLGGRNEMLQTFANILNIIVGVINPIREGMQEIFPPMTAQRLFDITRGIRELTESFKIGEKGAENLKRIFKGFFAFLDIGVMAVNALGKALFGLTGNVAPVLSGFVDLLARLGDFIVGLRDTIKRTDAFGTALQNIGKGLQPVIEFIKNLFKSLSGGIDGLKEIKLDGLSEFFNKLKVRFEPLGKVIEAASKFILLIGKLLGIIGPVFLKLAGVVADGISNFVDRIMEGLGDFDPDKIFDIINGGLLSGILLAIRNFVNKGSGAFSGIKDVLDGVKGSLEAWQSSLNANTLLKIAGALGIMAVSIVALSMIDSVKLTGALAAITVMFVELGTALGVFQKISALMNPIQMGAMAVGLIAISSAMVAMSLAVSKLGKLEATELIKGMTAIIAIIAAFKVSSAVLAKSSASMIIGSAALIIFSFAIRSLGVAVRELGEIDTDALTKGLVGVGVLITELVLFLKATDLSGLGIIRSVGILILAGAIVLLTEAVTRLSNIDTDAITKGLTAMGIIFAELSAFMALTAGGVGLIGLSVGVGILSASLLIMAEVLGTLGSMSWEGIAKGLTALAGALTIVGAAGYLMPPTLAITALGLVIMAGALVILAKAMNNLGGMSWDEVARGLTVLAGSLLILTVALTAMSGTLAGSAALFVAAAGLALMAPALKVMGSISWEEIARGIVALAATFVVLGVAGSLLTPVVPTLAALGASMALLGLAAAGVGVGLLAFSAGLAALAVTGSAGAAALVIVITSLVGLIPMVVKQLGKALLTLVEVLVAGAPTLLEGIVTLLNILLDGLIEIIPKVVEVISTLVDSLLTKMKEKTPYFVEAGYSILISFLKGVRANIGDMAAVATDVVVAFLNALAANLPILNAAGWEFIFSWIDTLTASVEANIPRLMESLRALGLAIIKGVLIGLIEGRQDAVDAIVELGKIIIDGFKKQFGINSPSTVFIAFALDIIRGLIIGIKSSAPQAIGAMSEMANKVIESVKSKAGGMADAAKDFVNGFANGIKKYIQNAVAAAAQLANAVLKTVSTTLQSHSPSRKTFEQGKFVDQGLAGGITKFAGLVVNSTKDLGNKTLDGFTNIVSRISDTINSDMDFEPSIRPVLDLSDVEKKNSILNGLLADKTLNMTVAANKASIISSATNQPVTEDIPTQGAQPVGNNISFTQINNSPKELSRIEIYRQTQNQLRQAKEMVG